MHDKQDLSIYRLQNIQSGNLKMQLFDGAQDDDQVFFIHLFSFFFLILHTRLKGSIGFF